MLFTVINVSIEFVAHYETPEAVDEDPAGCQRWTFRKKRSNQLKYKEKKTRRPKMG